MSQTITIDLPDPLFKQLKRAAELFRQPTETIIAQSLAYSLPPCSKRFRSSTNLTFSHFCR